MSNYPKSQIDALKAGIEALTKERRQYCPGYVAYTRQGIRPDAIVDDELDGMPFSWVERDYKAYTGLSRHIQQLEDLIEIITDPGVTIEQPRHSREKGYEEDDTDTSPNQSYAEKPKQGTSATGARVRGGARQGA